jgi:Aspartyl/Asparaginyl beta-hydroxylase
MTPDGFLHALRATGSPDAVRCLRLLQLDARFFAQLRAEVEQLVRAESGSDVGQADHVTNWTRPRGIVRQFSLLNASGRLDDFSADHNASCFGKRFHRGGACPALARLIEGFPHAVNFRINLMGPGAQLAPHEEQILIRTPSGAIAARLRCHLPVASQQAEIMLDGGIYHLEPGSIYFVNHGCMHAARNAGSDDRIHLVWDMLLTREAAGLLFGEVRLDLPAVPVADAERVPAPLRTERIGACLRLPQAFSPEDVDRLDWCEIQ